MIKDFVFQLRYIPRALILTGLLICTYHYLKDNKEQWKEKIRSFLKKPWLLLFLFYTSMMLMGTIFARQTTYPLKKIFGSFGFSDDPIWNNEIVENLVLFIPYIFLYLQAFLPLHPFTSIMKFSAVTTTFIEGCQLLFCLGNFQLADMVHNMIGGVIGYALWRMYRGINRYLLQRK